MDLAIYLLSAGLIVLVAFAVFRVIVRRDYRLKGRTTPLSVALELLVCIAYMAFPYTYLPSDWYLLPPAGVPALRRTIALALIIGGVALTVFAMFFALGIQRAMGWQVDKLIDTGPYRLSRNPQLVCFALVVLGSALYWPDWRQLGWLTLYAIVFHMMVITEEEHLENVYGEAYRRYCQQVPRYIGVPNIGFNR